MLSRQQRLTEVLQLWQVFDSHIESFPAPCLRAPPRAKHGTKEYRIHEPIALFLATRHGDQVAAVSIRTGKRLSDGLDVLVSKNTELLSPRDTLAINSLRTVLRDMKRTKESIRRSFMLNCHLRMRRCFQDMGINMLTMQEFRVSVDAYRAFVGEAKNVKRPLSTSRFYLKDDAAMEHYRKSRGLPDIYIALLTLFEEIQQLRASFDFETPMESESEALRSLCNRWHKLASAVSWFTMSHFCERMMTSEGHKQPLSIGLMNKLGCMRARWLEVAKYDMAVLELFDFANKNPVIASTFKVRWVGHSQILASTSASSLFHPQDLTLPTHPGTEGVHMQLNDSCLDAAINLVADNFLTITNQEDFGKAFEDVHGTWKPTVAIHIHAEMRLLQHLIERVPPITLSAQLRHRGCIAIGTTGMSCATCSLYFEMQNTTQMSGDGWMWLIGPLGSYRQQTDVTFKLPGMSIDGKFVDNVVDALCNEASDFMYGPEDAETDSGDEDDDMVPVNILLDLF